MDIETARLVIAAGEAAISQINGLLADLSGRCSEAEFALLKREVARVMNGIDQNLYPIVLRQYPDLDPLRKQK